MRSYCLLRSILGSFKLQLAFFSFRVDSHNQQIRSHVGAGSLDPNAPEDSDTTRTRTATKKHSSQQDTSRARRPRPHPFMSDKTDGLMAYAQCAQPTSRAGPPSRLERVPSHLSFLSIPRGHRARRHGIGRAARWMDRPGLDRPCRRLSPPFPSYNPCRTLMASELAPPRPRLTPFTEISSKPPSRSASPSPAPRASPPDGSGRPAQQLPFGGTVMSVSRSRSERYSS